MKKVILFAAFILAGNQVFCQNKAVIDSLQKILKTNISDKKKVDVYNNIAKEYALRTDSANTFKFIAKANNLAKKTAYPLGLINACMYSGYFYFEKNNYPKAIGSFEQALNLSNKNNYPKEAAQACLKLGNAHYTKKDKPKALEYYQKALQAFQALKHNKEIAQTYHYLGKFYVGSGKHSNALDYFLKSLKINQANQYKKAVLDNYDEIGNVYERQGKYTKALTNYRQALKAAQAIADTTNIAAFYNSIGNTYEIQGNFSKAVKYYSKALEIALAVGNKTRIAYSYGNIGIVYDQQGNYSQAMEYYLKALKILQEIDNKHGVAIVYNNIGDIYKNQHNYAQALEYYFKSLKIKKGLGNERSMGFSYNNIGVIYQKQKKYNKALEYLQSGLNIRKKLNDKSGLATCYIYLGEVYVEQKQYARAQSYFEQSLVIRNKLGEKAWASQAFIKLGIAHYHQKSYDNALENLQEGVKMAKKTSNLEFVKNGAQMLAKTYEATGNFAKAYQNYQLFKQMSDSLFNESNTKKLTRMESEYGFEKQKDSLNFEQEKEKAVLTTKIEKEQLEKRMYRNINWLAAIVLVLLAGFAIFIFRSRQHQKNLNAQLITQKDNLQRQSVELIALNQEVQESNAEISAANEEINAINETLQDTLNTVKVQRDDIMSSINYAQRIQKAILPFEERMQQAFPEHFVLYKPRDVVSGDFYWFEEVNNLQILVVGDCTGHGVPGAFMTMLGTQALSNIVLQRKILEPDQILNALNEILPTLLKTKDTRVDDGMDVVVCVLDRNKKELHFAGAKNSLVLCQNNELKEIKGDIYSINSRPNKNNKVIQYTAHTFDISQPTTFYLYSDGYQDQFGGDSGKKIMKGKFRRILNEISTKPIPEQKQFLETTLEEWMFARNPDGTGRYKQTDDILITGVKLS